MSELSPDPGAAKDPSKEFLHRLLWLTAWLTALVPVVYVLSIGPTYRFLPGPALPIMYGPLVQLQSRCRPLDRLPREASEN
jgi:hypothetical protein